jgi:hypothetical protein
VVCIFCGCIFFFCVHNKKMASIARWSRSHYLAVGTTLGAIVIIVFLAWPLLFGVAPSTVLAPSIATSTLPVATLPSSPAVAAPVAAPAPVHLLVVAGSSTIIDATVSDLAPNENAFVLLKNEAAKERVPFTYKTYPGMGDLVTSIGGFANGSSQNYWQYTANGNYVPVGADDYVPQPGDRIVWKFMKSGE